MMNEKPNRHYTVEKSSDGRNFQAVTSVPSVATGNSTGKYQYRYDPLRNETGKLIFRLKQTDADGSVKYSVLRLVDLSKNHDRSIIIYPNPSAGNFSVQIQKLKDAGYIDVVKQFKDNYPQTICKITPAGIKAFEAYVKNLQAYLGK